MLNGMEFQTVGAASLKALRPTAVLVNGTCRKLCDADRRVLEGVLRLMKLVIRQSERSSHQQRLLQAFTEDVFIFSLLVYIVH